MPTQVHRIVLFVVDHDQLGAAEVASVLEDARYPNRCIHPQVIVTETREVEWVDSHPLNYRSKAVAAVADLFGDAAHAESAARSWFDAGLQLEQSGDIASHDSEDEAFRSLYKPGAK